VIVPQIVDEPVDRDRLVRAQQKDGEESLFLRAADVNPSALVPHFEGSEDPKFHTHSIVTGS
jgi:hypothetical protein